MAVANPEGLGAVLVQHGSFGPRIIANWNKFYQSSKDGTYSKTEKEAQLLLWGVEHFHMAKKALTL